MNSQTYIENVKKAINKYCKINKCDLDFDGVFDCYNTFKNGDYLPFKHMGIICQFRFELEYIHSLNL